MMSSKFSFGKIKDLPKDTGLIHKKATRENGKVR